MTTETFDGYLKGCGDLAIDRKQPNLVRAVCGMNGFYCPLCKGKQIGYAERTKEKGCEECLTKYSKDGFTHQYCPECQSILDKAKAEGIL